MGTHDILDDLAQLPAVALRGARAHGIPFGAARADPSRRAVCRGARVHGPCPRRLQAGRRPGGAAHRAAVRAGLSRERGVEASKRADEAAARASQLESRVRALTDELDARTGYRARRRRVGGVARRC